MPTSEQKIPNGPLSGEDVKEVSLHEIEGMVQKAARNLMDALRSNMDSDPVFGKTYAHPRVKIEAGLVFHWASVNIPKRDIRLSAIQGNEPAKLNEHPTADHFVEASTRELTVENPNAVRAHANVPVTITEVTRPQLHEIVGSINEHVIPVTGAPEIPIKETDNTEQVAKDRKIPQDRRIGRKQR